MKQRINKLKPHLTKIRYNLKDLGTEKNSVMRSEMHSENSMNDSLSKIDRDEMSTMSFLFAGKKVPMMKLTSLN